MKIIFDSFLSDRQSDPKPDVGNFIRLFLLKFYGSFMLPLAFACCVFFCYCMVIYSSFFGDFDLNEFRAIDVD